MNKHQIKISKLFKMLLSFVLTSCLITVNISNVLADNIQDVGNYPKKQVIKYNGKITYGNNIVGDFTVDGEQAFCMEHPKLTPSTGTSITSQRYSNENVQKVLYYGWGGPEQWGGLKDREHGIVVTSLALSYYYYGDNSSPNTIKSFIDFISNKDLPDF